MNSTHPKGRTVDPKPAARIHDRSQKTTRHINHISLGAKKKNMRFVSTGIQHALKPGEGKPVGRRPSKLFVFLYCLTHVKPIQQRQQLVSKFIQANHLSAPVMSVLNSTERYLKWRNRISPSMRRCGLIPRQGVSIRRRKCRTTKVGGIQSYTTSPRCGSRPQKTSNAVGDSGTLYVHSMP